MSGSALFALIKPEKVLYDFFGTLRHPKTGCLMMPVKPEAKIFIFQH